ncbi:MAG: FKBP-type peptidyl-prolyl cis-trans isomerase [Bacteroidia bacterium]|nr:FKBP-type peptidyl-prolyl cis-trans isomerase [Bacteroidia bacterium]
MMTKKSILMKKSWILICGLFLMSLTVFAQEACKCEEIPGFKRDLCFDNEKYPAAYAQFQSGVNHFYFKPVNGKKYKKIELASDKSTEDYLISLANNKALKVTANDVLFLQSALSKWGTFETESLIKKVGDNKRTEADLVKLATEKTASGLGFQLMRAGKGKMAEAGKKVTVHYRGYLTNGQIFDASFDRGAPFEFALGKGQVIKGWDEGIAKLHVGDHAVLRIPAELGYGARKVGSIPENSELIFEVILLGVQ